MRPEILTKLTAPEGGTRGLYRTTLVGPGGTLVDAFASIERSTQFERVLRHAQHDLLSARVSLTPEEGEGYWELTRVRSDLYIIILNFKYKSARFEFVPGDGLLQFNFKVSGDLTYAVSQPGPLRFNRPSLHLWRQPEGIDMREWTAAGSHERMVTICVRPEFLISEFLPSTNMAAPLQGIVSGPRDGVEVDYCHLQLTANMLESTSKLLSNPYSGALYLKYQEALSRELLCTAVGYMGTSFPAPAAEYSERELRALAEARDLLREEFSVPRTATEIARYVRLSEKVLMTGFKAVYGVTPFDFGLGCRMQHAMTLLQDHHWSVDRVSEAVGYSHPSSFATAFNRQFGIRPSDMKRQRKIPRMRN